MTRTEWILDFYKNFSELYKASPDIAYLKSVTGQHSPVHIGEVLMRENPLTGKNHPIIDVYIYNYFQEKDPVLMARQAIEAIIKIGTAIALCNMSVAKMAKTNPDITKYYHIKYFTDLPNIIQIQFKTSELVDIVITMNFIRHLNMLYTCLVNDRFCEIDNLPKKLKKLIFNK